MIMKKTYTAVALVASLGMMSGCATNLDPNFVDDSVAGQTAIVELGTITSVRQVTTGSANAKDRVAGTAIGGIAGGVLGSLVKGGRTTSTLSTIGGIGAGALIGNTAQKAVSEKKRIEYTVKLDSGATIATIQDAKQGVLSVNTRVRVIEQKGGRSRVVPA